MTRDVFEYDIDDSRAQKALEAIQEFAAEFENRQEIGELGRLVNGESLDGGILEQAPEDFTEHELIEPCLHALGYPQQSAVSASEPELRRQPARFPKVEQKRPDYELRNVDNRLTCIVEVKAINREPEDSPGKATEDIADYLEDNTFCQHAQMDVQGVLVGIGTDGFRWVLWIKDLETGNIYENVTRESIRSPVRKIMANRLPEETSEQKAHQARIQARKELKNHLIAPFSLENLPEKVADKIDRITI